jgi:hypothetical protein
VLGKLGGERSGQSASSSIRSPILRCSASRTTRSLASRPKPMRR